MGSREEPGRNFRLPHHQAPKLGGRSGQSRGWLPTNLPVALPILNPGERSPRITTTPRRRQCRCAYRLAWSFTRPRSGPRRFRSHAHRRRSFGPVTTSRQQMRNLDHQRNSVQLVESRGVWSVVVNSCTQPTTHFSLRCPLAVKVTSSSRNNTLALPDPRRNI
jgi:hypothetical protein